MNSVLEEIQTAVAAVLEADRRLAPIDICARFQSDVDSRIESAILSGAGLGIIVLTPLPLKISPCASGPVYEQIEIRVRLVENTAANRSDMSLLALAEHVSKTLHLHPLDIEAAANGALQLRPQNAWTEVAALQKSGRNALDIHFLFCAQ